MCKIQKINCEKYLKIDKFGKIQINCSFTFRWRRELWGCSPRPCSCSADPRGSGRCCTGCIVIDVRLGIGRGDLGDDGRRVHPDWSSWSPKATHYYGTRLFILWGLWKCFLASPDLLQQPTGAKTVIRVNKNKSAEKHVKTPKVSGRLAQNATFTRIFFTNLISTAGEVNFKRLCHLPHIRIINKPQECWIQLEIQEFLKLWNESTQVK